MGAWGTGIFENDRALDQVYEITEGDDLEPLSSLFETIEGEKEYIDADDGESLIAAAAVIAAVRGNESTDLPDALKVWISEKKPAADRAVALRAADLIDRILGPGSELAELWSESTEYFAAWESGARQLQSKLREG